MRKTKKNKSNKIIIIGISYFVVLLTISTAYSFLNSNLSIQAKTGILSNTDEYESSYILQAKWNEGTSYTYHFVPTINYLGDKNITGWKIYIKVPYDTEIIGCYNASSCTVNGETLIITNLSTNGTLSPTNSSISLGFQMKTSESNYEYNLIGISFLTGTSTGESGETSGGEDVGPTNPGGDSEDKEEVTEIDYISPILNITGGWGNTSTYILKVENKSDTVTLSSWNAEITFPANTTIQSLWGGEYKYDDSTGLLTLRGPDWSPSLAPNGSAEINIFADTGITAPYTPLVGKFTGITYTGNKIQTDITIGG